MNVYHSITSVLINYCMSDYSTTIDGMEEEKSKQSLENQGFVNMKHPMDNVDNVDKLFAKECFADFYYISGTHGYQQVLVDTIF